MKDLTKSDYQILLKYYNIPYKNLSKRQLQNKSENIIAEKLCKCIKKVDVTKIMNKNTNINNESSKIAICTDSILSRKGLKTRGFTCKKKPKLTKKNNKPSLHKTKNKLLIGKNKTLKSKN